MEGLDGSLIWPENEMLEGFPAALKHTVDEADYIVPVHAGKSF